MPGKILTTSDTIQCMHGGQVTLLTSNTKLNVNGAPALLESDIHQVAGCPFLIGNVPSPCMTVEWSAGAGKVKVNGTPVLVKSSIGKCYSAQRAPQGVVTIVNTQMKVSAT